MTTDILIVDDEADIRELISDILQDEGFTTRTAENSDTALAAVAERSPNIMLLDIWLQGSELDGLGILELVKKKHPEIQIIMISGHGNIETAVSAIKAGAYDFIEKPFESERLLHLVSRALENSKLHKENKELKLHGKPETNLTGNSQAISHIRTTIEKVAPTHSRVMITGAPGTGKEVAARMIHRKSARSHAAFVPLNAVTMTPEQLEVELFGREDPTPGGGAEKTGLLERAHGGTLFIDEVAEMPLETQGRLLRALQEKAFVRVNGNKPVEVDVRVIAASNHDLQAEIDTGNFRQDLFYRLSVVPVVMPSLKERRDDIPELCQHFLKRASELSGIGVRSLTEDAIAVLQSYHWPGNVRQLRNIMEWLLIMAPGNRKDKITASMLPAELFKSNPAIVRPDINTNIMSMPLREARELFEKQYLSAQIARFGGNISKTSHFVGMERSALHRKLKMLGISNGPAPASMSKTEMHEPA